MALAIALFISWMIVGNVALAVADKDGRLYDWFKEGPMFGQFLVLILWPLVIYKYNQGFKDRGGDDENSEAGPS